MMMREDYSVDLNTCFTYLWDFPMLLTVIYFFFIENQDEWHVDQGKLQKQIEQYKNERKAMGKKGKRK